MEYKAIDCLFCASQKSDAMAVQLFNVLKKIARKKLRETLDLLDVKFMSNEEQEDTILDVISYVLMSYDSEKSKFSTFVYTVFNTRITGKVIDFINSNQTKVLSLDECNADGLPLIESVEDSGTISIPDQISLNEAHLIMSSPKHSGAKIDSNIQKIKKLMHYGFKQHEIMKQLNLTIGQYHYARKMIKDEAKLAKMKMEMH